MPGKPAACKPCDFFERIRFFKQMCGSGNNVEQDHRGVKRITRPILGFKSFDAAQATLTGIELMRMIKKDQMEGDELEGLRAAKKFYALAS